MLAGPASEPHVPAPKMPPSLALSASVPAANDFIGTPAVGMLLGAPALEAGVDADPAAGPAALGAALRSLSPVDAAAVLEALAAQAAALSLVLAADSAGAINLPASLREIVQSASVLPAFLGGAT